MSWLSLVLGVVTALSALISYLRDKKLIDAQGEARVAAALREQLDDIEKATKARDEARDAASRVPVDQPLPDDGHRRD